MARGDSVINVSIIGDAKKLVGALNDADVASGGLLKSAAKVLVAGKAVQKGFDFVGDALDQADRVGDASARLGDVIGDIDAAKLADSADNFAAIGASAPDMLALEAAYADLAKSAGIAAPDIAANAEKMAELAAATALVHDEDPSQIIDAIGKAAGGATRGMKPYGVDLTEAAVAQRALQDTGKDNPKMLTDTELAAARVALIMEGLAPKLTDAAERTGDLGDNQAELGAKFETVMGKIGAGVEGPLADLLDFINDEIDAIPGAIAGWAMLGQAVQDFAAPAARVLEGVEDAILDVRQALIDAANFSRSLGPSFSDIFGGGGSDSGVSDAVRREQERNAARRTLGMP